MHHHVVVLREHNNRKIKKAKERHVELGTVRIELEEKYHVCENKGHPITNFITGEIATDDIIGLKENGEIARDELVGRYTQITQN